MEVKRHRVRNSVKERNGRNVRYWTFRPIRPGKLSTMANGAIDRRSARTRAMLQHDHVSLILEKGYEAVTIKDICEAANVGRSTFDAHYTGKDDLRRSSFEHLRGERADRQRAALATAGDGMGRSFGFSLTMFEHARDHMDLYRALVDSRGGDIVLGAIRQILCDLVRDELAAPAGKDAGGVMPREVAVQYLVGAYMAVLTWGLDGGAKPPPRRMDEMFRRLATEGVTPAGS